MLRKKKATYSYESYQNAIIQLLCTHYVHTNKSTINFNDFSRWKQDDDASCNVRCALFARYYLTSIKYQYISKMNVETARTYTTRKA